jgi:uncharacterized protein HemY
MSKLPDDDDLRERKAAGGRVGGRNRWSDVPPAERAKLMRAAALARWGDPNKRRRLKKKAEQQKNQQRTRAGQILAEAWKKIPKELRSEIMREIRKGQQSPNKG